MSVGNNISGPAAMNVGANAVANDIVNMYGIDFGDKKDIIVGGKTFCSYWVNKKMGPFYKYCNSVCFYRTPSWTKDDNHKYFIKGIKEVVETFPTTMAKYFGVNEWFIRIYIDATFVHDDDFNRVIQTYFQTLN